MEKDFLAKCSIELYFIYAYSIQLLYILQVLSYAYCTVPSVHINRARVPNHVIINIIPKVHAIKIIPSV
jgi:hypothetical protein